MTKYLIKEHFKCQARWKTSLTVQVTISTEFNFGFTILRKLVKLAICALMWQIMKLSIILMMCEDVIALREIAQLLTIWESFFPTAPHIVNIFSHRVLKLIIIYDRDGNSFNLVRFPRPLKLFSFLMMDIHIKTLH